MTKRIYSLNLAAYIQMETGIEPDLDIDYSDANGSGLVHCVFPECEAVSSAIANYKKDNVLHEFLRSYADLRASIKDIRKM